jgi:DNA polymerase
MAELLEYGASDEDGVNYQVQTLAAARLSHKSTIEETRAERFLNIAKLPWDRLHGVPIHHRPMLPVALRYGGAHTHRLAGEWAMNMQNLPRNTPGTKSRLRRALVAPPGFTMITADLAQIEARIVAALCGESKLVEAFRRGEDVYSQFASLLFHKTVTKANIPERFIGKTAILGLGYNCGAERFYQIVTSLARAAGISLDGLAMAGRFDEHAARETVNTYRALFALIPRAWRQLDHYLANYLVAHNPDQSTDWGPVTFKMGRIILPNRMTLRYTLPDPHLYGGKLLENITQALARIVVMQAAVRLSEKGLRFVMQAHDELVFVVLDAFVEDAKLIIQEEMTRAPAWMPDLPLAVEIGQGANYGACK